MSAFEADRFNRSRTSPHEKAVGRQLSAVGETMIPRFARNDNGPGMASDGFLAMVS
jgi:hypothetical protein